jgi:hypothetical protein
MIRVDELPPPRPGSVFPPGWHETVGSSGAGKAMNLARLGVDVVLHCQLGEDEAGRRSLAIGARVASLAVQSPELASADLSPNSVADLP